MDASLLIYLPIHGIVTVGAVVANLIRTEHRITKVETILDILNKEHARIMHQHGAITRSDEEP